MASWKSHVRAQLQLRDQTEKLPYEGVYTSLSQLEERFEIRQQFLEDIQSTSSEDGVKVGENVRLLQLGLRESEHLAEKLSQTVSDLTTVLYLKDAELQHWQSRVSHHRQEALTLAKASNALKTTFYQHEYTIERQVKELATLHVEQSGLKESLSQARSEKEHLLRRWMEEKKEEADRLNKYNDAQERWQRVARHLRRHLYRNGKKDMKLLLSNRVSMVKGGKRYSSMSNDGNWKSRTYTSSQHDNKLSFQDNIIVFDDGAGRRKCAKDISQHKSNFCLCQQATPLATEKNSVYGADFATQPTVETTKARRFPRDHHRKCAEAPLDGGDFMWFGQDTYDDYDSLEVLGFANLNAASRPM
ncbi:autophagy-related protein 16-1-like isoform X2 [Vanacampus margaritifer]